MLAYIWLEKGVFPGDVFNRPYREKLFIYAATSREIEQREKENKKLASRARKKK